MVALGTRWQSFREGGARVPGVEIFRSGHHRGKDYSEDDLKEMVKNFNRYSTGDKPWLRVPAVLGHEEDQEWLERSDLPAAAWATRLNYERQACPICGGSKAIEKDGNAEVCPDCHGAGTVLVAKADFGDLPRKVKNLLKSKAYRTVSAEVYDAIPDGLPNAGEPEKMLRRVAFLGGEIPQIKSLEDIPDVEEHAETGARYEQIDLRCSGNVCGTGYYTVFFERGGPRDFCDQGPNKGKPGPCPGAKKAARATRTQARLGKHVAAAKAQGPKPERHPEGPKFPKDVPTVARAARRVLAKIGLAKHPGADRIKEMRGHIRIADAQDPARRAWAEDDDNDPVVNVVNDEFEEFAADQPAEGKRKDSLGRERCYRQGKEIPCPDSGSGEAGAAKPGQAAKPAGAQKPLTPEQAKAWEAKKQQTQKADKQQVKQEKRGGVRAERQARADGREKAKAEKKAKTAEDLKKVLADEGKFWDHAKLQLGEKKAAEIQQAAIEQQQGVLGHWGAVIKNKATDPVEQAEMALKAYNAATNKLADIMTTPEFSLSGGTLKLAAMGAVYAKMALMKGVKAVMNRRKEFKPGQENEPEVIKKIAEDKDLHKAAGGYVRGKVKGSLQDLAANAAEEAAKGLGLFSEPRRFAELSPDKQKVVVEAARGIIGSMKKDMDLATKAGGQEHEDHEEVEDDVDPEVDVIDDKFCDHGPNDGKPGPCPQAHGPQQPASRPSRAAKNQKPQPTTHQKVAAVAREVSRQLGGKVKAIKAKAFDKAKEATALAGAKLAASVHDPVTHAKAIQTAANMAESTILGDLAAHEGAPGLMSGMHAVSYAAAYAYVKALEWIRSKMGGDAATAHAEFTPEEQAAIHEAANLMVDAMKSAQPDKAATKAAEDVDMDRAAMVEKLKGAGYDEDMLASASDELLAAMLKHEGGDGKVEEGGGDMPMPTEEMEYDDMPMDGEDPDAMPMEMEDSPSAGEPMPTPEMGDDQGLEEMDDETIDQMPEDELREHVKRMNERRRFAEMDDNEDDDDDEDATEMADAGPGSSARSTATDPAPNQFPADMSPPGYSDKGKKGGPMKYSELLGRVSEDLTKVLLPQIQAMMRREVSGARRDFNAFKEGANATQKRKWVTKFCEKMVKQGRLTPAQLRRGKNGEPSTIDMLMTQDHSRPIYQFSERGKNVKLSQLTMAMRKIAQNQPFKFGDKIKAGARPGQTQLTKHGETTLKARIDQVAERFSETFAKIGSSKDEFYAVLNSKKITPENKAAMVADLERAAEMKSEYSAA